MKSIYFLIVLTTAIGCSMKRLPAVATLPIHAVKYNLAPCDILPFEDKKISLLPSIRLIDCSVKNELTPEEVEFEFIHTSGQIFGKQTGKLIEEVNLNTNEYGANYYLNYAPINGVQDSLGRWCCWNENANISINYLLPDELNAVHIESDGGMIYRASWNVGSQPRGLAIILCGLGGMQHASQVLGHALLKRNWAVVHMYTALKVPDYSMEIKLQNDEPALSVIEIFNSKYCQVINATKAVRNRMESKFPSLGDTSTALIGISAGALNAPAVYNEIKDDIDAIILIAGGANMFEIVQDGAFTNWKFTDKNEVRFSKIELAKMNEKYLQTPSRDPYFLAELLPKEQTLIVHAKWDHVVPFKNGDMLYERSGMPERWIYPSGHLGLFATFEWYAEDIAEWLQSKVN